MKKAIVAWLGGSRQSSLILLFAPNKLNGGSGCPDSAVQ
jgi:hypothetical protein